MAKMQKQPATGSPEAPLYVKDEIPQATQPVPQPTVTPVTPETPTTAPVSAVSAATRRLKRVSMPYVPYVATEVAYKGRGIFKRKVKEKAKYPNALIISYQDGHYAGRYEYVKDPIGLPYDVGGWLFFYTLHDVIGADGKEGQELRPLATDDAIKVLPESLFRKLHKWLPYHILVSESLKKTLMEKLKIGLALAFFGISAFILFLIVISLSGS